MNSCSMCFSEYLATFKKTVAMHEVFLQRMAAHPVLRSDVNFKVFLEYDQEVLLLCVHQIIYWRVFLDGSTQKTVGLGYVPWWVAEP